MRYLCFPDETPVNYSEINSRQRVSFLEVPSHQCYHSRIFFILARRVYFPLLPPTAYLHYSPRFSLQQLFPPDKIKIFLPKMFRNYGMKLDHHRASNVMRPFFIKITIFPICQQRIKKPQIAIFFTFFCTF